MLLSTPLRRAGRLLAAALGLLLAGPVAAQVLPQYTFTASSDPYTPLTGGTVVRMTGFGTGLDDNYSPPAALPFGFQFGAQAVSTWSLNTNGWLTFGPSGIDPYNTPLAGQRDNLIAFLGMDLTADVATFQTLTTGTAPTRIFKIEARRITEYNVPAAEGSVQVWLYEGSNQIDIRYGAFTPDWTAGTTPGAQVGLRGLGPADVRSVAGSWAAPVPSTSATVLLTLNGGLADIPADGQLFTFAPPAGVDLTPPVITAVTITPAGGRCAATDHVVGATITDAGGVATAHVIYRAGATTDTLAMTAGTANTYSATLPATLNAVTWRIRATDSAGNSAESVPQTYRDVPLRVTAGPDQLINAGTSAVLTAVAVRDAPVRITEFTLNRAGSGATPTLPAWVPGQAADFVELTNLATAPADLAGYTLLVQAPAGNAAARTYTFPDSTLVPGRSTLLLHLGPGRDSAAVRYYNTGGPVDALTSGGDLALVLLTPAATVLDAVLVNAFPVTAPVTVANWTGPGVVSAGGVSGASLRAADTNNNAGWRTPNGAAPQSLGTLNTGLPTLPPVATVTWTGGLLTAPATANPLTTPVHPTPGTYQYVVIATDGVCTITDTVAVVVITPAAPVAAFVASDTTVTTNDVVTFTDRSTGIPATWRWHFLPDVGPLFVNGTTAQSRNPDVRFAQPGRYTVALTVTNPLGSDSLTRFGYIDVTLQYCVNNLQTSPCLLGNGFIDGVIIVGTSLRNVGTGCPTGTTAPGYSVYPPTGSTTAALEQGGSYDLTVTSSTIGSVGAWIDYNNDGVFDSAEFISVAQTGTPNQPVTVRFTVPDTARLTAATGLRIRNGATANSIDPTDACATRFTGETEDYLIRIDQATAAPAASLLQAATLWPNPTTGRVQLSLPAGTTPVRLTVFDALGRLVASPGLRVGPEVGLDLSALGAGMYFLRIDGQRQHVLRRLEIRP